MWWSFVSAGLALPSNVQICVRGDFSVCVRGIFERRGRTETGQCRETSDCPKSLSGAPRIV